MHPSYTKTYFLTFAGLQKSSSNRCQNAFKIWIILDTLLEPQKIPFLMLKRRQDGSPNFQFFFKNRLKFLAMTVFDLRCLLKASKSLPRVSQEPPKSLPGPPQSPQEALNSLQEPPFRPPRELQEPALQTCLQSWTDHNDLRPVTVRSSVGIIDRGSTESFIVYIYIYIYIYNNNNHNNNNNNPPPCPWQEVGVFGHRAKRVRRCQYPTINDVNDLPWILSIMDWSTIVRSLLGPPDPPADSRPTPLSRQLNSTISTPSHDNSTQPFQNFLFLVCFSEYLAVCHCSTLCYLSSWNHIKPSSHGSWHTHSHSCASLWSQRQSSAHGLFTSFKSKVSSPARHCSVEKQRATSNDIEKHRPSTST